MIKKLVKYRPLDSLVSLEDNNTNTFGGHMEPKHPMSAELPFHSQIKSSETHCSPACHGSLGSMVTNNIDPICVN
jgi:hypothetical protein